MSTEARTKPQNLYAESRTLLDRVNFFRLDASRRLDPSSRAGLGQFLTPPPVARLMATMFESPRASVSLLDAGAGAGSLTAAFVDEMRRRERPPEEILVTAYEIDPLLVEYLNEIFKLCREACERQGIRFAGEVAPTVKGLRMVWELRGISCLPLEMFEKPRKGLYCSCSFGRPVTALEELSEAVAMHCVRGGEKLRGQRLAASHLTVFISTPHVSGRTPKRSTRRRRVGCLTRPATRRRSWRPRRPCWSASTSQGSSTTRRASS